MLFAVCVLSCVCLVIVACSAHQIARMRNEIATITAELRIAERNRECESRKLERTISESEVRILEAINDALDGGSAQDHLSAAVLDGINNLMAFDGKGSVNG